MANKPEYLKIAEALEHQIEGMAPNSLLHTEQQLARRFNVSRVTIRRALGVLQRTGLISRERGRGTIVSPPKISRRLVPVCTLEDDLHRQGLKLETRVVNFQVRIIPPARIRERLRLRPDESTGFIALTRLVDDRIISHDQRYISSTLAARFDPALVAGRAVPHILQELAGQPITSVHWESQITAAPYDVAIELGTVPGVLLFVTTFVHYLKDGEPAEAGMASYRIDRVKFNAEASGPSSLAMALPSERPIFPTSPPVPSETVSDRELTDTSLPLG